MYRDFQTCISVTLKQAFFVSDFLLYHYSDFLYYKSLLYYGKNFKKSEKKEQIKNNTP